MNIRFMMKSGTIAGFILLLALSLSAGAATSVDQAAQNARQDVQDARQEAAQKAQDIKQGANSDLQNVRNNYRDSVNDARQDVRDARNDAVEKVQDQRNDQTMKQINRQEDKQTVGEYLDDAGVTAKVKAKFVGQKGLDSLDIKVVTVNGKVTLMGDVDNSSQVGLAESVAKEVDGVRQVDNQLIVKP